MIDRNAIDTHMKQQEQKQAAQWDALHEHFASRGKPKEPDPELVQRIADDTEARIGLELARKAESDAKMAALQEAFAKKLGKA